MVEAERHVAETLSVDGMAIWRSESGQVLVVNTHPKLHRLLASYFSNWAAIKTLRKEMDAETAAGGNPYVTMMEGQGWVESPRSKVLDKKEKKCRDAERTLGITASALAGEMADDDSPNFE